MALSKHIDDLFDECLVPVLARVPFNDLVRHVPLTSQRWNALLHLAIRERTSLRLYNKYNRHECNQPRNQFIDTGRVSEYDYVKYLQCLLTQSDDQHLYAPCDHYLRNTLKSPFATKICDTFRNLEHFTLVGVQICPKALLHLLEHFQKTLKSLFLNPSGNPYCGSHCEHHQIDFYLPILPVINSMTSLRQLALARDAFPCIDEPLSAVLSRLEELHLICFYLNIDKILFCVDDTKFRRLTLQKVAWDEERLSTCVSEKPGLSLLTHLNVDINTIFPYFGMQTIKTVVKVFPRLEHLGINTNDADDPLRKLIPEISQLKNLSSLHVTTENNRTQNNFSLALPADQQIEYRLESLQVLRLKTYLRIDSLDVIRALFPNLRQFYIEAIHFQCLCFEPEPTFFRLPSLRPPECTCKARIANHLDSFEYLPKIRLD